MTDYSNRISQDDLAGTIDRAVALESQRIEQLGADAIDQVDGGGRVQDVIDIILGIIFPDA